LSDEKPIRNDAAVYGFVARTHGDGPGALSLRTLWLVNDQRTGLAHGLMFAVQMLENTDKGDTFTFNEIFPLFFES
jgi:hypothetical protein